LRICPLLRNGPRLPGTDQRITAYGDEDGFQVVIARCPSLRVRHLRGTQCLRHLAILHEFQQDGLLRV
jgi:hypothetical protein